MICKWSCFKFMSLFCTNWPPKMAATAITKKKRKYKTVNISWTMQRILPKYFSYWCFHWVPNVKAQSRCDIAFLRILVWWSYWSNFIGQLAWNWPETEFNSCFFKLITWSDNFCQNCGLWSAISHDSFQNHISKLVTDMSILFTVNSRIS